MTVNTDPLCPQQHTHPKHNPNRCIFCEYGAAVRAAALDAAREAVAALLAELEANHDEDRVDGCWEALQAIDALRGDDSITSRRVIKPSHESSDAPHDDPHLRGCPCNNADERGCFLISAETGKCISCTCEQP